RRPTRLPAHPSRHAGQVGRGGRGHPPWRAHRLRGSTIGLGLLTGLRFRAGLRLSQLSLHPIQMQVDLPLVVATEPDPEHYVVDFLGGDGVVDGLTGECGLDPVEETVDLIDLVAPAQRPPPEPLSMTGHRSTLSVLSAASCPQAPSISRPRVSRTVVVIPAARRRRTNSRSTAAGLASHRLPGVGLSGMRLTWASRPANSSPRRVARHGWSFTSRIMAYSMDNRRP